MNRGSIVVVGGDRGQEHGVAEYQAEKLRLSKE